jgi:hypothetical protein
MTIIGVVGLIGSGKGAVAEYLVNSKGYKKLSFADPVKDAAAGIFGWSRVMLQGDTPESRAWREEKDEYWSKVLERPFSPRIALQEIGTEVGRNYFHPDIWLRTLEKKMLDDEGITNFVIDDCRFSNELELIKSMGGKIILVERGERPEWWNVAYNQNNGELTEDSLRMEKNFKTIHPSEWKWISKATFEGAATIYNGGTVQDLENKIESIVNSLDN